MGLSAEQEVLIRTYFETTYNLHFGVPTECNEETVSPNEHVMILQYLQLNLLNYPSEPLEDEFMKKVVDGSTVSEMLNEFLNTRTSPLNPDVYFRLEQKFTAIGDKNNPANSTDIIAHLIKVIEIAARQMEHGYLKQENDPKKSSALPSSLVKLGIFSGLAIGAGMIISHLCDGSPSDLIAKSI